MGIRHFLHLAFLLFCSNTVLAWEQLTNKVDIHCDQEQLQLVCQYRALSEISSVNAFINKEAVNAEKTTFQASNDTPVTVLFVIDTSDPARQNVVEKNKQHVEQLIDNAPSGYQFGLAAFDKTLRIEVPPGESSFLLKKKLQQLQATGKTTELYRNVIEALQYLDTQPGSRKALILMSDGQAEDKAYFHADVIRVARKTGIVINAIGYPRSTALSVALQTIRRLSEETGGTYMETNNNYELPTGYFRRALDNLATGGTLIVPLDGLSPTQQAATTLQLVFSGTASKATINIPIQLPRQSPVKTEASPAQTTVTPIQSSVPTSNQPTTAPVTVITRQIEAQPVNLWLWYGIPAAFIIIIIFILITLFLLWQRPASSNKSSSNYQYKPYAYLIDHSDEQKRYPITRTIWRIGRGKDNELALDDSSISRRHAEIHRNINGSFDIMDMNSMNGVYINGEKIGKALLQEGDVIEVGDILLRFSQFAPEHEEEDSTVMQKTKVP